LGKILKKPFCYLATDMHTPGMEAPQQQQGQQIPTIIIEFVLILKTGASDFAS